MVCILSSLSKSMKNARNEESKNVIVECDGSLAPHISSVSGDSYYCYQFFVDDIVVWNESRFQASVKGIVSNNQKVYFGQNNNYTAHMIRCDDSAGFVKIR